VTQNDLINAQFPILNPHPRGRLRIAVEASSFPSVFKEGRLRH
jgi:hypothetical protein